MISICCIVTNMIHIHAEAKSTIMTNEHTSLEKYTSQTLFEMAAKGLRKGYVRVMCERWVGDWTATATYWPPVPLSFAALLSRSAGLLNRGAWVPSRLLRAGSHCLELQQLSPNWLNFLSHRVISISSGRDYDIHCWWDLIRSKQLSSVPVYRA